jgi:hypothetical protein
MNTKLLLLAVSAAVISSCSTAYKSGQTPDDVYFSPVRTYEEETRKEDNNRDEAKRYDTDDRQIRMGINDRRWRNFDNDISYSPYSYGYNYGYYYNPYYCSLPVYTPAVVVVNSPKNTTPRKVNLGGYGNGYVNNNTIYNPKTGVATVRPVRTYNNSNNGSKLGNTLNRIFSTPVFNNGNSNTNTNTQNNNSSSGNRTYTPSSSNSSKSSSGSSSGSGVTRPARGNGKG